MSQKGDEIPPVAPSPVQIPPVAPSPVHSHSNLIHSRPNSSASVNGNPLRTGKDVPPDPGILETSLDEQVSFQVKEPLPPIPGSDMENITLNNSSDKGKSPGGVPLIVTGFKSELDNNSDNQNPSQSVSRVSFAKEDRSVGSNPDARRVIGYDGKEHNLVSISCQTDMSLLEDYINEVKSATPRLSKTPSRSQITDKSISSSDFREELQAMKSLKDDMSIRDDHSEIATPFPSRADEYGIPLLEIDSSSSSSSSSSDEEEIESGPEDDTCVTTKMYKKSKKADEKVLKKKGLRKKEDPLLPAIGPPPILQYNRESLGFQTDVKDPIDRIDEIMEDIEKGEEVQMSFQGPCDFCGNPIKKFPTLDEQLKKTASELYCCEEYKGFMEQALNHPLHVKHHSDQKIDIKPHPPHGSKVAREAAKQKAAQRMREREIQRQQAQMHSHQHKNETSGSNTNFYQSQHQRLHRHQSRQSKSHEHHNDRPHDRHNDHHHHNDHHGHVDDGNLHSNRK